MDNSQGLKKSQRVTISEENNVYHSYDGSIEDLCNIGPESHALLELEAKSEIKLNYSISQQSKEQESTKQYENIIEEITKRNGSTRHEIDLSNKYRDEIITTIRNLQVSYTSMGDDFQHIQVTLSIMEQQQNVIHNEEQVNNNNLNKISSKLNQNIQDKMNYLSRIQEQIEIIERHYKQFEKEFAAKILNFNEENDNLKQRLENCVKTISELEQEKNVLEEKISETNLLECNLNDDLKNKCEDESKINEEINVFQQSFENEKLILQERMEAVLSKIQEKESEVNILNVKLEDLEKENVQIQEVKKELTESNSKLNSKRKELEQIECNTLQEINVYSEKISAALSEKTARLNEANTDFQKYREMEMNIQQALNNIIASKTKIEMEFISIEHEINSENKPKNEFTDNIKSCEMEINTLEEQIKQVEDDIAKENDLISKLPTQADLELEKNEIRKKFEDNEQHNKHLIETLNNEFLSIKQQQEDEINAINKFYTDEAESLTNMNSEKQACIEQSTLDIKNIEADISGANLECAVLTRKINSRKNVIEMEKKNVSTLTKHSMSPPVKQPKMSSNAVSDNESSTDGETIADVLKRKMNIKKKKLLIMDKRKRFTQ